MNVYGTDVFYLVPGEYITGARVGNHGVKQALDDIVVDFPDGTYSDLEFFALDANTHTNAPAVFSGGWHDASNDFARLCQKNPVDPKKVKQAKKKVLQFFT
jgi:hypothetical protein